MNYKSLSIKVFLSLALLGLLACQMDFSQLKAMVQNIHPRPWLIAAGFLVIQLLLLSVRWMLLLNADPLRHMNFKTSFRITSASFLANYFMITSVGGIIIRIFLSIGRGFLFIRLLAATIVDRCMTLAALVILTAIVLPFAGSEFFPDMSAKLTGLLIAAALGLLAAVFLIAHRYRRPLIFLNRKITLCVNYLRRIFTNPVLLSKITLISLGSQLAYFFFIYIIMVSLYPHFSLLQFLTVIPLITIISTLPIGYGGWGIREGAFVYGFSLIHIPAEAAFMTSVQAGILSMITAAILGLPVFLGKETQDALKNWKNKKVTVSHAAPSEN